MKVTEVTQIIMDMNWLYGSLRQYQSWIAKMRNLPFVQKPLLSLFLLGSYVWQYQSLTLKILG